MTGSNQPFTMSRLYEGFVFRPQAQGLQALEVPVAIK